MLINYKRKHLQKDNGFSLVELLISLLILLIILSFTLPTMIASGENLKKTEMEEFAKNLAIYILEYIRSRNLTFENSPLKGLLKDAKFGLSYGQSYTFGNDNNYFYPGLIDVNGDPLSININPSLPFETYNSNANSFYSVLQGYIPWDESDPNLNNSKKDIITGYTPIIKFTGSSYNFKFSAKPGYIPKIFTTDVSKTNPNSLEYDPHYTINPLERENTMKYDGYRILTQIVSRKRSITDANHAQFYSIKVTIFWTYGKREFSHSVSAQLMTYGGD